MAKRSDYEGHLLSAVLKDNNFLPTAKSLVSPEMLEDPTYKNLYEIILKTYAEKGAVDVMMVTDQLSDIRAELALQEIVKYPGILTVEKLQTYAEEISRRSKIGKINNLASSVQEELKNISQVSDTKLQTVITKLHGKLFEITGDSTYTRPSKDQVMLEMKEDMLKYSGRDLAGLSTGWETLDVISRGIGPQQLWVVGAYTSIGKSWFSLKLASNLAKKGTKVLYLSTEMSEKRLYWRLATILSKMPEVDLIFKQMNLEENANRQSVIHEIEALPIEIKSGIGDVNDVIFEIRKGKAQGYCDVAIVDFIQNLASGKDETAELANAVRSLQNLALRENVAVIMASQNNRESQKQDFETLYGFKGSSAIETAADIAIILSRVKDHKDQYLICDVQKNRNGMTGTVLFTIDMKTGQFEDEGFYDAKADLPAPIKSKI